MAHSTPGALPAGSDTPALPIAEPQDASFRVPRGKRPSELAEPPAPSGAYLSVAQAAVSLGVSRQRIRALISAGWLRAEMVEGAYRIRKRDMRWVSIRKPGRPRK